MYAVFGSPCEKSGNAVYTIGVKLEKWNERLVCRFKLWGTELLKYMMGGPRPGTHQLSVQPQCGEVTPQLEFNTLRPEG